MKAKLIRLILYISIAMVPLSCGTRKTDKSISKTKTDQGTKSVIDNTTIEQESKRITEANTELISDYAKDSKFVVTKRYDAITGQLVEETSTVEKSDKGSSSSKSSTRTFEETKYKHIIKHETITIYVTKTTFDKDSQTSAGNAPLYWAIFGIGAIAVIAFFLVKYLKK